MITKENELKSLEIVARALSYQYWRSAFPNYSEEDINESVDKHWKVCYASAVQLLADLGYNIENPHKPVRMAWEKTETNCNNNQNNSSDMLL